MFIKSLFGVTLESWWWKQFKHLNGIIYSEWFSYIFNLNPKIFLVFFQRKEKRSQTFIEMNARWYDTHSAVHKNELLTKGFLD